MTNAPASRRGFVLAAVIFGLTVAQLLVGTFVPGIERFEGKGYGYRLVVNPILMAIAPLTWWFVQRRRPLPAAIPWTACALIMASFLFDALGNSFNLYDSIGPWDNISHFVTWLLLLGGAGLMIAHLDIQPRWVLVLLIGSLGALLAVVWEIGEWYTFIRRGTELEGAYEDTLSDQLLGTTGAFLAGFIVERLTRVGRTDLAPPADATTSRG